MFKCQCFQSVCNGLKKMKNVYFKKFIQSAVNEQMFIFTLCQCFLVITYLMVKICQVIVRVLGSEGVHLPKPMLHPLHAPALYSLMCQCWGPAAARPSLDHILAMLRHLHSSHSEEDFQRRWDALKPTTSTPEVQNCQIIA